MIAQKSLNYNRADIITNYTIGRSKYIGWQIYILQTRHQLGIRHFAYEGMK
jgi:hypothetical protein